MREVWTSKFLSFKQVSTSKDKLALFLCDITLYSNFIDYFCKKFKVTTQHINVNLAKEDIWIQNKNLNKLNI